MQTGQIQANLVQLNREFNLPYLPDLIARKIEGAEKATLDDVDLSVHQREYRRLCEELEQASQASQLPDVPTGKPQLNDLLIRLRMASLPAPLDKKGGLSHD